MYAINWVVLVLMTAGFLSILGAAEGHFDTSEPRSPESGLSALMAMVSFAVTFVVAFVTPMSLERVIAGSALLVAFFLLFGATKQASRRTQMKQVANRSAPVVIVQRGPYRVIRHPFYAAYVLFWLAVAVATAHWLSYGVLALMVLFYARTALLEERVILAGARGADYQAYMKGTSRFLPRIY